MNYSARFSIQHLSLKVLMLFQLNILSKGAKLLSVLIIAFICLSCAKETEDKSCLLPPQGITVNGEINISIGTRLNNLSNVALVYADHEQDLGLEGIDLNGFQYFTNWQTIPSINFNILKFNIGTEAFEIPVSEISWNEKIIMSIVQTPTDVLVRFSEYKPCTDINIFYQ